MKRANFMTVINGVLCLEMCVINTRDTFQPSRLTGVRLWTVIILQSLWSEIGGRIRSQNKHIIN